MTTDTGLDVVTGATGYSGQYMTRRLLGLGRRVKSLTGHLDRENPFEGRVALVPYNFEDPVALAESLRGTTTLYNTYWIRFSHGHTTFEQAVRNTKTLLEAARAAGVRKVVHVSIANPDKESPFPYYRGKAVLEEAVITSGLDYAIIRPTVIFGPEDILINNIAWLLRKFPIFAVAGSGTYRIQPIFVEDMTKLAVDAGQRKDNTIVDAVGPEIFTFNELVRLTARTIRSRARIIHVSPSLLLTASKLIGTIIQDVVLTKEEMDGLMADLLASSEPPTGTTRFSEWIVEHSDDLGSRYTSELARHYRPSNGRRERSMP